MSLYDWLVWTFWQFWSGGVPDVVVVELRLLLHLLHLLGELIQNVLSDEVGSLELLAAQWTQPLVFADLLAVGGDKFLHLVRFCLQTFKEQINLTSKLSISRLTKLERLLPLESGGGLTEGCQLVVSAD